MVEISFFPFIFSQLGLCSTREASIHPLSGCVILANMVLRAGVGSGHLLLSIGFPRCSDERDPVPHPSEIPTHTTTTLWDATAVLQDFSSPVQGLQASDVAFPRAGPKAPWASSLPAIFCISLKSLRYFPMVMHTPSGMQKSQCRLWLHYGLPHFYSIVDTQHCVMPAVFLDFMQEVRNRSSPSSDPQ